MKYLRRTISSSVLIRRLSVLHKCWVQIRLYASRPVTKLWFGTASAGDTHSLACRTYPPTASIVLRHRVAKGYWKGDKHLRPSQLAGETCPCISLLYCTRTKFFLMLLTLLISFLIFKDMLFKLGSGCFRNYKSKARRAVGILLHCNFILDCHII